MTDRVRSLQHHRNRITRLLAAGALLFCGAASMLRAQGPLLADLLPPPPSPPVSPTPAIDTAAASRFAPRPGDVLTPNTRRNTPDLKIGIRAGINRSNYTNDRYLNNVALDVGDVSGETDIYTSAAGFGFQVGADLEYPLNQALSVLAGAEYAHVSFGSRGSVQEPCVRSDGSEGTGMSIHEFRAGLDYLRIAATAKLTFSSWYLTAGLIAEHAFSTSLERTRRFGSPDSYYPGATKRQVIEESGEIPSPSTLHYGIRLGAGILYRLSDRLQFAPELTLDFGISTINKSPNSDLGVYGLSATLRYDLR